MTLLRLALAGTLGTALALAVACTNTEACTENATQCSGDQVQTCVGGVWEAAVDCPQGQTCMTMEDTGMQHCMAMDMGDDDDSTS